MLWELEGAGLAVDARGPVKTEREKLYEEDCVEMFLAPDPAERTRYYEVEVGPLGHFFDIAVDRKTKKSDTAWSSQPEIATKVDRERAPRDHRGRAPLARRRARARGRPAAAVRALPHGGQGQRLYLAWSPTRTAKPNFHVPEAFGTLLLE